MVARSFKVFQRNLRAQVNAGMSPLGDVGVVIGATVGSTDHDLTVLNGPILAPGLGAQGAQASDLPARYADAVSAVLPSYSRELLAHGPTVAGPGPPPAVPP